MYLVWTVDEKQSFQLLDALVDHGLNAIDTADVYSKWVDGNEGGESETIIGNWLKANPEKRDTILIFTKVGSDMGATGQKGLSSKWIEEGIEKSLRRLNIDVIDLYQSHWFDDATPMEETLATYEKLVKAGKIRTFGCSNFNAAQLSEAMDVASRKGLPAYQTLQPEYNLYDRAAFDGALTEVVAQYDLGVITYYSLASGFLSGKYRSKADIAGHNRGNSVEKYLDERGMRILAALDAIAKDKNATQAEVALAWVMNRPHVKAPIASATKLEQLLSLVKATQMILSDEDMAYLNKASA